MMQRLIIFIWVLSGFLVPTQLVAQLPQSPEYLYARTDKQFYLSGEDIWYAIHFMNPSEQQSAIVYVDFHGPAGNLIEQQILKVENNVAAGDFALSSDLRQGMYVLRAYTAWNLNFSPQEILEKEIPVYEAKLDEDTDSEEFDSSVSFQTEPSEGISLQTNKDRYLPREPMELELGGLSISGGNAAVSVSILSTEYLGAASTQQLKERVEEIRKKTRIEFATGRQPTPPEQGYTRNFVLKNPGTSELVNSNFIMGYIKQTQQKLIQSASSGIVSFTFEDFYDSTIVQIFDTNPFYPTYIPNVSLISSLPDIQPPKVRNTPLQMTDDVRRYIDGYQQRYQLNKLFGVSGILRAAKAEAPSLELKPTTIYRVDDFVQHESMSDFVKNVVPPIKVVKANKKIASMYQSNDPNQVLRQFKLFVPNKDNRGTEGVVKKPPIILINDYFTYNAEAVLNMEWENIRQIDVFNSAQSLPVQFGPIGNFGVIGIHTRDGVTPGSVTLSANNLVIPGFYRPRTFGNKAEPLNEYSESKIPSFLPMMYWNPRIDLQPNANQKLEIIASDQPGSYLIRVEGIGKWGNVLLAEKIVSIGF